MISKAGVRFLEVALSCPHLLGLGSTIVAPLFVLLGPGGLPLLVGVVSGRFAFGMRFPVLLVTASLRIFHACDEPKFDPSLQI